MNGNRTDNNKDTQWTPQPAEYHYADQPRIISEEELRSTMTIDECRERLLEFVHQQFLKQ